MRANKVHGDTPEKAEIALRHEENMYNVEQVGRVVRRQLEVGERVELARR